MPKIEFSCLMLSMIRLIFLTNLKRLIFPGFVDFDRSDPVDFYTMEVPNRHPRGQKILPFWKNSSYRSQWKLRNQHKPAFSHQEILPSTGTARFQIFVLKSSIFGKNVKGTIHDFFPKIEVFDQFSRFIDFIFFYKSLCIPTNPPPQRGPLSPHQICRFLLVGGG